MSINNVRRLIVLGSWLMANLFKAAESRNF
jgi:hypothetical protein